MKAREIVEHLARGCTIAVSMPDATKPDDRPRYFIPELGKSVTAVQFRNLREKLSPVDSGLFPGAQPQQFTLRAE